MININKIFGFLLVICSLVILYSVNVLACGGYDPSTGGWVVNSSLTCSNEVINVNGTLVIEDQSEIPVTQFNTSSNSAYDLSGNFTVLASGIPDLDKTTPVEYTNDWDPDVNREFYIVRGHTGDRNQIFVNDSTSETWYYVIDVDGNRSTGVSGIGNDVDGTELVITRNGAYCWNLSDPSYVTLLNPNGGTCNDTFNLGIKTNTTVYFAASGNVSETYFITTSADWKNKYVTIVKSGVNSGLYTTFKNSAVITDALGSLRLTNITLNLIDNLTVSSRTSLSVESSNITFNLTANGSANLFAESGSYFNLNSSKITSNDSTLRYGWRFETGLFNITNNNFSYNGYPNGVGDPYENRYTSGAGLIFNNNFSYCGGLESRACIDVYQGSSGLNISHNIFTNSSIVNGVLFVGGNNTIVEYNTFYSRISFTGISGSATNNITIDGNTFYHPVNDHRAIDFTNNLNDSIIKNNNFTYNSNNIFGDVNLSLQNTMIYSNSYGEIKLYHKNNLTFTDNSLWIGNNLYLEDNKIGLSDNIGFVNLDTSANITFYGLSYPSQPWLLKNGVRCDNNSDLCNITSWDGGTLVANVSSFSNYTTFYPSSCGEISTNTVLTNSITASGTCFNVTADNVIIDGAGFKVTGDGTGYGINITKHNNVTVKNMNITNFEYGLYNLGDDDASNNTFVNNTFYANNLRGIHIYNSFGNIIEDNNVTLNNVGLFIDVCFNNTVLNNNISSNYGYGLYLSMSTNNTLASNILNLNQFGLYIDSGSEHNISNNNISSSSATGLYLVNTFNNTFMNNNLFNVTILDNAAYYNYFMYSNDYGEIKWYLNNLSITAPANFSVNNSLYLENNNIGLVDDTNFLRLNTSANITFYGLSYPSQPWLLKNGVRCDNNSDLCNITSWDGGTLVANVSSFSNYTTAENVTPFTCDYPTGPYCGHISSDLTLTHDVCSTNTCFTIDAPDITLDCSGYVINYSNSSTGYGINLTGFNNITVKNCNLVQGLNSSDSSGIYFKDSSNNFVNNTNITVTGASTKAVYLTNSNSNNITNTVINMSTTVYGNSYALLFNVNSLLNRFENSTINTGGLGVNSIEFVSNSNNNSLSNVNITSNSVSALGVTFVGVTNNVLDNVNLIMTGAYNSHAVDFASGSSNNVIMNSYLSSTSGNAFYTGARLGERNYVVNSTFNKSNLGGTGDEGIVYVGWFVDVNITNSTGNFLENAYARNIADEYGVNVTEYENMTNSNGQARIIAPEFFYDDQGAHYIQLNYIKGIKSGYASNTTSLVINETNNTNVSLVLLSSNLPSISFSSNIRGASSGEGVLFSCSAEHTSGISSLSVKVGSSVVCSGTSSCSALYFGTSSYTAVCTATNNDGYSASDSLIISVYGSAKGCSGSCSGSSSSKEETATKYTKTDNKIQTILHTKRGAVFVLKNGTAEFSYRDNKPVLDLNLSISELLGNYSRPDIVFIPWFVYGIAIVSFLIMLTLLSIGFDKSMAKYNRAETAYITLVKKFSNKNQSWMIARKIKTLGIGTSFIARKILTKKSAVMPKYSLDEYKVELDRKIDELIIQSENEGSKSVLSKIRAIENLHDAIRDQLSNFSNKKLDKKVEIVKNKLVSKK